MTRVSLVHHHFIRNTQKRMLQKILKGRVIMDARKIYKIETNHLSMESQIQMASKSLAAGQVIALPTDTVYGLACDANDPKAIRRLYEIKGRNEEKPVAICVADLRSLRKYGDCRHLNDQMLAELFPGPLTVIVERTEHLANPYLNGGLRRIGIRIPDAGFVQALCSRYERQQPLALTSANPSSVQSSLCIEEFQELWPLLDLVFDGGRIGGGGITDVDGRDNEQRSGSTVVDLSQPGHYQIIRNGIGVESIRQILHKYGLSLGN